MNLMSGTWGDVIQVGITMCMIRECVDELDECETWIGIRTNIPVEMEMWWLHCMNHIMCWEGVVHYIPSDEFKDWSHGL